VATAERPERRSDPRPDRARRRAEDRALDNQHLTVLGVLLGLGATVGLTVGFNVGGWAGVIGGILSGIFTPLLLALAFRSRRTRYWLAAIADWVVERPLEEAVKDVHHLAHGLDNELEKALHRLEHAADRGHMWPPSEAAPNDFWQSHDDDLRSLGWHYHGPVRDAYRQMEGLNELARERAASGRDGDGDGDADAGAPAGQEQLTPSDRRRLREAGDAVSHALERLDELDRA
jgi:hypothetical protein